MTPGTYDFSVAAGDCLPLIVILKDEIGAVDLTGYQSQIDFTWRGGSLSLLNADLTITTAAGKIAGELTALQTADLPAGRLTQYKWWVTEPSGCKKTFLDGYVEVE
jgi:hypothetical protein